MGPCLRLEKKPGPFRAASSTATGDSSEGTEPTVDHRPTSLLLELGRAPPLSP